MLQAPRRIPGTRRDALTGEPLVAGLPIYVMHTPLKKQRPRYLQAQGDEDVVSAPLTLHRHVQDGAVGLAYSVMMAQYLALVGAEVAAADRREVLAWWTTEYGVKRVGRLLATRHDEAEARKSLEAVLTCHQREADPAQIAAQFNRTETWLLLRIDECMHLAHGFPRQMRHGRPLKKDA